MPTVGLVSVIELLHWLLVHWISRQFIPSFVRTSEPGATPKAVIFRVRLQLGLDVLASFVHLLKLAVNVPVIFM